MSLEELNSLASRAALFGDTFGEKQLNLSFNLSMMIQPDELKQDRLFQMSFVEFLESLARMAEPLSLKSPSPVASVYEQDRTKQPLYLKLEGLCYQLFRMLGEQEALAGQQIQPLFFEEEKVDESSDEELQAFSLDQSIDKISYDHNMEKSNKTQFYNQ
eukprot:TRINITY_DN18494_c0_g1_i1.p1 TRINITY_DN18494_c0_g1~~TRINITY_DN18494_c0_g1_i1.p1  ORF type:complete len:159 (-),score=23.08 TRINITY_DN18494_c0_g1_i1:38-514(-)